MSRFTITLDEYAMGRYYADHPSEENVFSISDEDYYNYIRELFPASYPVYDEALKEDFFKDWADYFRFYEIGQETPARFSQALKVYLKTRMPYYQDLWASKLDELETYFPDLDITRTETGTISRQSSTESGNVSDGTQSSETTRTPNLTTTNNGSTEQQVYPINGIEFKGTDNQVDDITSHQTGSETTEGDTTLHNENDFSSETTGSDTHNMTYKTTGYQGVNKLKRISEFRELLFSISELIFHDMKRKNLFMTIY